MTDYFATLARYHAWATDVLLEKTALMREQDYRRDAGLFFKSVHGTLNHLLAGELHWYARLAQGISLTHALDAELETDRAQLAETLREAVRRWQTLVPALTPQHLTDSLRYTRVTGAQVTVPYAGALGHAFNHGTHHRGQISAALTAMGYPCPEMDLVYMLQREAS